jgi:hypothetical protein
MVNAMELLDIKHMDQDTCLVRDCIVTRHKTGGVSDLLNPRTDGQVVFLAPGSSLDRGQGKGKAAKEEDSSLPVEEDRVSLLSTTAVGAAPHIDTLAQLLAQGFHSNDTRVLDSVLDRPDLELINNTVKRIPADSEAVVVSLVSVLQKYIKWTGMVILVNAESG